MPQPALPARIAEHVRRVRVRAITPDELYTFAPPRAAAFAGWLRRYWDTGNSCPEWCFVAEQDGRYVGSVVYEGDVRGRAVHVEHVRLPWRVRQDALVSGMATGGRPVGEPLFPVGHVPTDEPHFWQLAYDAAGNLIGLVVPRRNGPSGASGSISWIGVVPEHRARGYVDDLIARGLAILQAAGVERVHAATHVLNTPMQAAFPRMGFRHTEMRWWYEFDPAHARLPHGETNSEEP